MARARAVTRIILPRSRVHVRLRRAADVFAAKFGHWSVLNDTDQCPGCRGPDNRSVVALQCQKVGTAARAAWPMRPSAFGDRCTDGEIWVGERAVGIRGCRGGGDPQRVPGWAAACESQGGLERAMARIGAATSPRPTRPKLLTGGHRDPNRSEPRPEVPPSMTPTGGRSHRKLGCRDPRDGRTGTHLFQ